MRRHREEYLSVYRLVGFCQLDINQSCLRKGPSVEIMPPLDWRMGKFVRVFSLINS